MKAAPCAYGVRLEIADPSTTTPHSWHSILGRKTGGGEPQPQPDGRVRDTQQPLVRGLAAHLHQRHRRVASGAAPDRCGKGQKGGGSVSNPQRRCYSPTHTRIHECMHAHPSVTRRDAAVVLGRVYQNIGPDGTEITNLAEVRCLHALATVSFKEGGGGGGGRSTSRRRES